MNEINILHLSDLHYDSSNTIDSEIVLNALWKDLEKVKKEENIEPDIVIFSGDIVKAGDKEKDFEDVEINFITPLLEKVGLDYDFFFICTGNHDLQTSKIKEIHEIGLDSKLNETPIVNDFLDKIDSNLEFLDRLQNFNKFKKSFLSTHTITSNILFSTHRFRKKDFDIGIACLNSCWRSKCEGKEKDYGHLIIGERQIDNAVNDIKDSKLKIAVIHHPFEWLNPFEQSDIQRRLFCNFELVLFGHNHEPQPKSVYTMHNNTLQNISGCLYQNRKYYNGYSIINYNYAKKEICIFLRSYFDNRREFDKGIDYVSDGKICFYFSDDIKESSFPITSTKDLNNSISILKARFNQALLSSSPDCSAPKDIKEIFVDPIISTQQKEKTTMSELPDKMFNLPEKKEETHLTLDKILTSDENYLIIGAKESGKTTLLEHMCLGGIENYESFSKWLPLYINCKELPKGMNPIQKSLNNFIYDAQLKIDPDEYFREGKCLILIDDISFDDLSKIEQIKSFTTAYPKNKYILTMQQDLFLELDLEKLPDINIKYQKLFIQPFTRKQVKILLQKWFKTAQTDIEETSDKVMNTLVKLNIPKTPFIVSILLWIYDKKTDYVPINKAVLIENFIEIILEKINMHQKQIGGLDYRDNEYFLSYIANRMIDKNNPYFTKDELITETRNYFQAYFNDANYLKGSLISFIDYFIQKGIFLEINGEVSFKFKCFLEYFIAKRMSDNKEFYDYILKENNYLSFINEIDYLTGLQRNNKELLILLDIRLDSVFKKLNLDKLALNLFDNMDLKDGMLESEASENLLEKIQSNKLDENDREQIIDNIYSIDTDNSIAQKEIKTVSDKDVIEVIFAKNIILFSQVFKNCQLIEDTDFKKKCLMKSIKYWAIFLLFSMIMFEDKLISMIEKQKEDNPNLGLVDGEEIKQFKEKAKYFFKMMTPVIFQSLIYELLGNTRLASLLNDCMADQDNQKLENLLYVFLYSDLKLPNYITKIKELYKQVEHNSYAVEIIFSKILVYYNFRRLTDGEKKMLESLMKDIISSKVSCKEKLIENYNKEKILSGIKEKRLHVPSYLKE